MAAGASPQQEIFDWIEQNTEYGAVTRSAASGASGWASAFKVETQSGTPLFVKMSTSEPLSMFQGEAEGLRAMHQTHTIRVPNAIHYGELSARPGATFIVMEHLDMRGRSSQKELGLALAKLHLAEPAVQEAKQGMFGFHVNNTIGGTFQPNEWTDSWVDFFREKRIMHQIKLAKSAELRNLATRLCDRLPSYFEGITVQPSVLHGDLWSGNIGAANGEVAIFDPATYYGHHEAEFGMSWCAGFGPEFWDAYHSLIPRAPGFKERHKIYTLYHYLNHYNLFGGGYYNSAYAILSDLVGK
ncbi:Protein-ribulosamine 3-kinase, chloroplastic [Porphyridium purpureum]|uniref:protein-ribulosamine 3-kinase n=1 Tax=Porphyridium purpureum TaxID=35688 RepID=A0A5J4YKK4_PORPP|nr:Protein-ribulosamine 3-kinase, chloroplastic [Porphyridium purpureum]|eukprot:POR8811..scf244_11